MQEQSEILKELKLIRELLTELTERKTRRKQSTPGTINTGQDITGTLNAAFADRDRIPRKDLYLLELQTAKQEHRPPVHKKTFFNMVESSGYRLTKTNGHYYFYK